LYSCPLSKRKETVLRFFDNEELAKVSLVKVSSFELKLSKAVLLASKKLLLTVKLLEVDIELVCANLRFRILSIEAIAGKKYKQMDKYKNKKPRKTQKSCEKKENVSN
jgi:hypothetical protein